MLCIAARSSLSTFAIIQPPARTSVLAQDFPRFPKEPRSRYLPDAIRLLLGCPQGSPARPNKGWSVNILPVRKHRARTGNHLKGRPGSAASICPTLHFQHIHAKQPPRLHRTIASCFCLLAADSTRVHPQQPVNTSLFAATDCRLLIPLWLLYSNPPGVNL